MLDRLLDKEPDNRNEPASWRSQSLKELKDSVRRDLEWLLNARRTPMEPRPASRELWNSVYTYGLPDSTGLALRSAEYRAKLARAVEFAVARFSRAW